MKDIDIILIVEFRLNGFTFSFIRFHRYIHRSSSNSVMLFAFGMYSK